MTKPISLKDHLAAQATTSERFVATVEAAGAGKVKITPWRHGGCGCSLAFDVDEAAIVDVTPTGDVHACCGKRLQIVEITFAPSHKAIVDVVSQLQERASVPELTPTPYNCTEICAATYAANVRGCNGDARCITAAGNAWRNCLENCHFILPRPY